MEEECRPSISPFWAWYQQFIDTDLERARRIGVILNDCFAVRAERIRRFPKAFYERIFADLTLCQGTGLRAVADSYMERSWKAMFDSDPAESSSPDEKNSSSSAAAARLHEGWNGRGGVNSCPFREEISSGKTRHEQ